MPTKRSEITYKSQIKTQKIMTLKIKNDLYDMIEQRFVDLQLQPMSYLRKLVLDDLEKNGFDVANYR